MAEILGAKSFLELKQAEVADRAAGAHGWVVVWPLARLGAPAPADAAAAAAAAAFIPKHGNHEGVRVMCSGGLVEI